MYFWNHSFPSPEENVAWDEALVEIADRASLVEGDSSSCSELEAMRVWQFDAPTVVIGRGSRVNDEVYLERCLEDGVPVLRRASGGSTIIAGPGCLMYSVLISYQKRPAWRGLDVAHEGVMSKVAMATQKALNAFHIPLTVDMQGTCDLTIQSQKFSGNALRCKRNTMLYHGTILISMPLDWIDRYLREPPRQPEYREKRTHRSFVRNLLSNDKVSSDEFANQWINAAKVCWDANEPWDDFPLQSELAEEHDRLMRTRYLDRNWHFER
jgi:lipoate-protein ligase A